MQARWPVVRIFSDYMAEYPLWTAEGLVWAEDLGLSIELAAALRALQEHFAKHVHWSRGWDREEHKRWYDEEAERLQARVQNELVARC